MENSVASLLRMSEQELAKHVAGQGFRAYGAVSMATLATVLAFLGMASRQAMGEPVPVLPGAGETAGQIGWAVGLGLMMLAAWWLARNVIMKRLQTTIVVSLLMHLLLCVVFQKLTTDFPLANIAEAEEGESSSLSNVSLPDYGGMEATDAQTPDWEATTENAVTEVRMEEVRRQINEIEVSNEREQAEVERQQEIARAEQMRRQEVEVQQREMATGMQKQAAAEQAAAQAEAAPEVTTQAAAAAELQARAEAQRSESSVQTSERERTEIETQADPRVRAQQVESQRTEMTPEQRSVETASREVAAARAVEPAAASVVEVATADSAEATAREREMEVQRQSQASLSEQQRRRENSPATSASVTVANAATGSLSTAERLPANTAPASGGAAIQQRSVSSAAGALSSAEAAAQSVEVASVAGARAPTLNATSSSTVATRGNTGTVPVGAAQTGGGAVSGASANSTVAALGAGTIGRQSSAGSGQPQLGTAVSSPVANGAGRTGQRQAPSGGGGTRAGEVAVASAGASRASGNNVLASGPNASSVQRSTSGITGTVASQGGGGTGGGSAPSAARSMSVRGTGSGSGTTGLAARGAREPTARLGRDAGFSAEGTSRLPIGRSTIAAALPPGAELAEQGGALVIAGPQAPVGFGAGRTGSGSGGLSGPRTTTIGRRTAGLPGSSRSTGIGRTRSSLPISGGGGSGLTRKRSTGVGRPVLASASEIAGLIKRSTPGPGGVQSGPISAGFSMRRPDVRREAVRKLGGNDASERAVERGLKWLADHQFAAGNWSIHELNCKDHNCLGHGSFQADTAATGLAMLAFLGAGHSHRSGEYQDVVGRGLQWLIQRQKADGDLFVEGSELAWLYSHGMAAIALCEAYGMTKDPALKDPAQRSLDFIVAAQHPEFGAWRYRPRFESDTSVSGWQLMALKSGQMAGLVVPKSAYDGVARWLDSVESKSSPGRFAYHSTKSDSLAMTAEGLLMRQYLGVGRSDAALIAGASYLKQYLPRLEERDAYYWYYATQVMFHMQGEHWSDWNAKIRDLLVDTQEKGSGMAGSWAPETPSKSKWGEAGGRHYLTCLNLLMLEVYYRHLPLYIDVKVAD
jgi:hypothetical protein